MASLTRAQQRDLYVAALCADNLTVPDARHVMRQMLTDLEAAEQRERALREATVLSDEQRVWVQQLRDTYQARGGTLTEWHDGDVVRLCDLMLGERDG